MSVKVLVTGHRGYIGANLVKRLADLGEYEIYGHDVRLHDKDNDTSKYLVECNLAWLGLERPKFDHVVHLGAAISVEESVKRPYEYWRCNVAGTMDLLQKINRDAHVVFASTAQVGIGQNPYTHTKEAMESFIRDTIDNHHIFRFFNVAGAGEYGQIGAATHLIRIAAEAAAGKRDGISINGTDYDTPDGTCVRDYIHVNDIVNAIISSFDDPIGKNTVPLGNGKGFSVSEVIDVMRTSTKKDFAFTYGPRRAGDPPSLICEPNDETHKYLKDTHSLEDMCLSAYKWEMRT